MALSVAVAHRARGVLTLVVVAADAADRAAGLTEVCRRRHGLHSLADNSPLNRQNRHGGDRCMRTVRHQRSGVLLRPFWSLPGILQRRRSRMRRPHMQNEGAASSASASSASDLRRRLEGLLQLRHALRLGLLSHEALRAEVGAAGGRCGAPAAHPARRPVINAEATRRLHALRGAVR